MDNVLEIMVPKDYPLVVESVPGDLVAAVSSGTQAGALKVGEEERMASNRSSRIISENVKSHKKVVVFTKEKEAASQYLARCLSKIFRILATTSSDAGVYPVMRVF